MKNALKKILAGAAALALAILCATGAAAEGGAAWGRVMEHNAVLYLQGVSSTDGMQAQVGNTAAEITEIKAMNALETPVHTTIILDNSYSIPSAQRPLVQEILEDLIGNRLPGEQFSIATISQTVTYLCQGQTDYLTLKEAVENIEYQNQETKLTDCVYEILQGLREQENGILQRVVLITDGVDNQQIGYTREELGALIQDCGYPLYTIGCSNKTAGGNEQLQNLFALSRLTAGQSFYLGEEQDANAIAGAIAAWNGAVRVTVALPEDVCDGSKRMVRVTESGGDEFVAELVMPFADVSAVQTPEATQAPGQQTPVEAEEPASPRLPAWLLPAVIAALAAAGLIALLVVVLLRRKKKDRFEYNEGPAAEPSMADAPTELDDKTEMMDADPSDDGKTDMLWDEPPQRRLILADVRDPMVRFEAPLNGRVKIGRNPGQCQIVVKNDPKVSRLQCEVYQDGGGVMLCNQSESNITKLNGSTVQTPQELHSGDVITMGRTELRAEIR